MKSQRIAVFSVAAAAFFAGCGGSSPSGSSGTTASPSPSPAISALPAVPAGALTVTLEDYDIMPATLNVKAGHVVFYVKNIGKTPHNFTLIDASGRAILGTPNITQGQARILEADITPAASKFICTQPGHRSLGMEGTLTVN